MELFGPTFPTKEGETGYRSFGGLPLLTPIGFGTLEQFHVVSDIRIKVYVLVQPQKKKKNKIK